MLKNSGKVKFSSLERNSCDYPCVMHVFELAFKLSWIQGGVAQTVTQGVIFSYPLVTTNTCPGTQPPIKTLVLRACWFSLGIKEQCNCPKEVQKLEGSGLGKGVNYRKYFSRRESHSVRKISWQWDVLNWVGGGRLLCSIHHQNIIVLSKVLYKF